MMSRLEAATGLLVCTALLLAASGCGGDTDEARVLGQTTVDIELRETLTRNQEAPIGNLVADALLAQAGADAQIALVNGGGLRCPAEHDATQCKNYRIPVGDITSDHLSTVLPFNNKLVILEITGEVLKSTLERGVSGLPSLLKGYFVQVAGLTFSADCSRVGQQLDSEAKTLVSEGDRVTAIKVGGVAVDPKATYKVIVNAFMAAGNDGHLRLKEATPLETSLTEHGAVEALLAASSPVAPAQQGRISLTADCIVSP